MSLARAIFALATLALSTAAAKPRAAPLLSATPEVMFVGLAARTCLYSGADPATVRADAAARGWAVTDPTTLPGEPPKYMRSGKTFTPTNAWQLAMRGTPFWVTQFDILGEPTVRNCAVLAWDLDFDAVDAVWLGYRRDDRDPARSLPVRQYNDPKGSIVYT